MSSVADGIATVPTGRWAVGVSGGADSVALLLLLHHQRSDLFLHVVHLDHETRAGESAEDARFVSELAARLKLPCTVETRSDVESGLGKIEPNASARYRAARLALFRTVVESNDLAGVILAHHGDDQAETVLLRLLRGSGAAGLAGMTFSKRIGELLVLRPMLSVRRDELRRVLVQRGQPWREDASNAATDYARNRVRQILASRPALTERLLQLGRSCETLRAWLHAKTPAASATLATAELLDLPAPLREALARRWLAGAGVPKDRIDPPTVDRLIAMLQDAATPARQHFPGKVLVRRTRSTLTATPNTAGA